MKKKLVLRFISHFMRIKKRVKLFKLAARKSKFDRFIKQNEICINFLLRLVEFIAKLIAFFVNFTHKTYHKYLQLRPT
jgi:hypothetical protein